MDACAATGALRYAEGRVSTDTIIRRVEEKVEACVPIASYEARTVLESREQWKSLASTMEKQFIALREKRAGERRISAVRFLVALAAWCVVVLLVLVLSLGTRLPLWADFLLAAGLGYLLKEAIR